jgi:hypothetical protein
MKAHLIDEAKVNFYGKLISMAAEHGARAFVVMERAPLLAEAWQGCIIAGPTAW